MPKPKPTTPKRKDTKTIAAANEAKAVPLPHRSSSRGRPPKWETPEEMYEAGLDYFDSREEQGRVFTIAGLALHLDLTYQGLAEYEEKKNFSGTVKKLKSRILDQCEERFYAFGQVAGPIFHSKQLGMKDKTEVEQTGGTSNVTEIRLPSKVEDDE